jgi:hypothetical protein
MPISVGSDSLQSSRFPCEYSVCAFVVALISSRAFSQRCFGPYGHACQGSRRGEMQDARQIVFIELFSQAAAQDLKDVTSALRECIDGAHAVVRLRSHVRQRYLAAADHAPIDDYLVRAWMGGAPTRAARQAREAKVIRPEGRHEPPPKMAQAYATRDTVQYALRAFPEARRMYTNKESVPLKRDGQTKEERGIYPAH